MLAMLCIACGFKQNARSVKIDYKIYNTII